MKTLRFISIALAGVLLVLSACKKDNGKEPTPTDKVTDACGNTYPAVKIGEQYWMAENLRCDKYANQSEAYREGRYTIPTSNHRIFTPYYTDASDKRIWNSYSEKYGKNLTDNQVAKLGYQYNWAAAVGVADGQKQTTAFSGNRQGICPNGWHIPSREEWQTLVFFIEKTNDKGTDTAGKHLKTTSGWYSGDFDYEPGLDTYGFAALPAGGGRGNDIYDVGYSAYFYSATSYDVDSNSAYRSSMLYYNDNLDVSYDKKDYGRSVRCIKD